MRLYYLYYHDEISFLVTFPIGIGSEGAETPPGEYRIVEGRELGAILSRALGRIDETLKKSPNRGKIPNPFRDGMSY